MSLPSGIYTAYNMVTSGKTVIVVATGAQYGNYTRLKPLAPRPSLSTYLPILYPLPGTSHLPGAVYTAFAMTTSGKTVIVDGGTGAQYGNYAKIYTIILFLDDATTPQFIAVSLPLSLFLGQTTYSFIASVDPLAIFRGLAAPGRFFTGVASPTANFFGYQKFGFFTGTADPRESMRGAMAIHFIATAYPKAEFLSRAGQNKKCLVSDSSPAAQDAPNFVY